MKNEYEWAKLFKEVQDEDRLDTLTMLSQPEIEYLVDALILATRRVTKEDISEQLRISVGKEHKTVHDDLGFFRVSCWISLGQCKVSYYSKISGKHQSVWLEKVAISSLKFTSGPPDFCLRGHLKEFLHGTKISSGNEIRTTWLNG